MENMKKRTIVSAELTGNTWELFAVDYETGSGVTIKLSKDKFDKETNKSVQDAEKSKFIDEFLMNTFGITFENVGSLIDKEVDTYVYHFENGQFASLYEVNGFETIAYEKDVTKCKNATKVNKATLTAITMDDKMLSIYYTETGSELPFRKTFAFKTYVKNAKMWFKDDALYARKSKQINELLSTDDETVDIANETQDTLQRFVGSNVSFQLKQTGFKYHEILLNGILYQCFLNNQRIRNYWIIRVRLHSLWTFRIKSFSKGLSYKAEEMQLLTFN